MLFKYFTEKETKKSVAVNPNTVKYVFDFGLGAQIVFVDGTYLIVEGSYLNTVTILSEQ